MNMEEDRNDNSSILESDSSRLADVDALAETVKDLYVQENIPTKPQTKELIQRLIEDFTEYDTTFLKEYLDVLQNCDPTAVKEVTNNIIFTIEEVLNKQLGSHQQCQEPVLVVLLGWMCVTLICLSDPHVLSPYRTLNGLLLHTTMKERVRLATALWRHFSPAELIQLADMTTGPKLEPGPEDQENGATLSDLILRAALCSLQPDRTEPRWDGGPLLVEEVAAGLTSAWEGVDADRRTMLAQVAARTHAVHALFGIARSDGRSETLKVLVEMSKLRLLFLGNEKKKKTSRRTQITVRKEE